MLSIEPLSIITVMHNAVPWVEPFLARIAQQSTPPVQVILIDAQSTDRTVVRACEVAGITDVSAVADGSVGMTQVRVVRMASGPVSTHYNAGLQLVHEAAQAVAFVRPTTCLFPFWIDEIHAAMVADPSVVGAYSDYDMRHQDGSVGRVFLRSFDARSILEKPLAVRDFVVRVDVARQVIGFDPVIPTPEYDFFLMASEHGLMYHVPRSLMEVEFTPPLDAESHSLALQKVARRRNPNG